MAGVPAATSRPAEETKARSPKTSGPYYFGAEREQFLAPQLQGDGLLQCDGHFGPGRDLQFAPLGPRRDTGPDGTPHHRPDCRVLRAPSQTLPQQRTARGGSPDGPSLLAC